MEGSSRRSVLRKARSPWLVWPVRILSLYALWLLAAFAIQRALIFPRSAVAVPSGSEAAFGPVRKHEIEIPGGRVECWFLPGEGASGEAPGPAAIFAHGNAELIDHQAAVADGYRALGVGVLLCEYRGYGRSDGSPSEAGIVRDFTAAYDWLASQPEVDPGRIVFHGRSLGAGVVCSLSRVRRPAAMVLQAPFLSVASMAARMLVPPFLVRDPFDNRAALDAYEGPVLIHHGVFDEVVPVRHGRALAKAARNARLLELRCGHNDYPVRSPEIWAGIEEFLREHGILDRGEAPPR